MPECLMTFSDQALHVAQAYLVSCHLCDSLPDVSVINNAPQAGLIGHPYTVFMSGDGLSTTCGNSISLSV